MLEEISEFTINGSGSWNLMNRQGWKNLSFDVVVPGIAQPVARIFRRSHQSAFEMLSGVDELDQEFTVHTGPELDTFAGSITPNAAYDIAGDSIGFVKSKPIRMGSLGDAKEFHQHGLGVLIGKPVGATAKIMSRPGLKIIPMAEFAGALTSAVAGFKMSFRGDSSTGFDVSGNGHGGARHFTIHDPNISRLLVFCTHLTL